MRSTRAACCTLVLFSIPPCQAQIIDTPGRGNLRHDVDEETPLSHLIARLDGDWQFEETWKAYWIGYTADMASIAAHGDDAIDPLRRFVDEASTGRGKLGAIYTLHLIGIERKVVGRFYEAFRNLKARDALLSLLKEPDLRLTVLSLLIRDPWPSDVPHLFEHLQTDTPHAWAFVKALQRYNVHGRPVHQDAPKAGKFEVRAERGSEKHLNEYRKHVDSFGGDSLVRHYRHDPGRFHQEALDRVTECHYHSFGDEVEYYVERDVVTFCSLETARKRWLDWYERQPRPVRAGTVEDLLAAAAHPGVDRIRIRLESTPEGSTAADAFGTTMLHRAAEFGHPDVIEFLLDRGASPSASNADGETPLDLAIKRGSAAIVRPLLPADGADVIIAAAEDDAVRLGELLVASKPLASVRDYQGFTPLHYAARLGNLKAAEVLVSHGVRADVSGHHGLTPLHEAARIGQAGIVGLLLRGGAPVDARTSNLDTPLHFAVRRFAKDADAVRLLLRSGSDPDVRDIEGKSPIHWAVIRDRSDVIEALLDGGASTGSRDSAGMTALHHASAWGRDHLVTLLLDRGARPEATDADGRTPLHEAAQRSASTVAVLLERGADVEARTSYQETPLLLSVLDENPDCARALLRAGAFVDARDDLGRAPLHWAAIDGDVALVQLLLDHGAQVGLVDGRNWTPLDWALERKRSEAAEALRSEGGRANERHANRSRTDTWMIVSTQEDCVEAEIRCDHAYWVKTRNPLVKEGQLRRNDQWRLPNTSYGLVYRVRRCGETDWGYWTFNRFDRGDTIYPLHLRP